MSKKVKEQSSLNQIKTSTNVLFNIIFLLLGLMCIFPLLFVFSISITSEEALRSGTYQIIPQQRYPMRLICFFGMNVARFSGHSVCPCW